ncbi:P27 family phage terminase small subunit [Endozoicomonas euniceicola]|uniref:P27 family phage terminase small subunit n=1 Tax=Endozoicomonas euniceicola TaxID=1234143 RepID=A0ABY6GMU6_9GAMM|nr:P27 family phage terminase small subunit [Endozoicomonas euniceicola]UYM14045.1 P27 family phage terminase small subunit [Endozoicomonas euniceicola]
MRKITKNTLARQLTKTLKDRDEYRPEQDALILSVVNNAVQMIECQKILDDEGLIIQGRDGGLVKHPATSVKRAAEQSMFTAFRALKMEPSGDKKDDKKDGGAIAMIQAYLAEGDL